jgi:hypothetical protein
MALLPEAISGFRCFNNSSGYCHARHRVTMTPCQQYNVVAIIIGLTYYLEAPWI